MRHNFYPKKTKQNGHKLTKEKGHLIKQT